MFELSNWLSAVLSLLLFANTMIIGLGSLLAGTIAVATRQERYEWRFVTDFMSRRKLLALATLLLFVIHRFTDYHWTWSLTATVVCLLMTFVVIPRARRTGMVTQEGVRVA